MNDPRLDVLLLQLPVPNNPRANIPLAAGYLKAYAFHVGLLEDVRIDIMPRAVVDVGGDALIVDEIVRRAPDVLGLSLYTWNSERTLVLAARAKAALPDLRIVVGGPEVQRDNAWILTHPVVDVAVLGEGEQTFVALLRTMLDEPVQYGALDLVRPCVLCTVDGIAHRHGEEIIFTPPRSALDDLSLIPSPYLLGYLPLWPGDMALVECSRWCPYRCSFCLYGRNMGSKLGKRLFPVERVAAEVAWARQHGADAVHFVEANLNLLPYAGQLTEQLRTINPDRSLRLYAELRGEHLRREGVSALVDVGLHAAEVGLQSANPVALQAVDRRTDLVKWAAGTRLLYEHGVDVFLDVILGLPGDDERGVLGTLDWIEEQGLGPYDVFTLQVLPGTSVRMEAARWDLQYQDRPPYYVLATDRLPYSTLRGLRWELKERAGFDPREIEGMPPFVGLRPQYGAWSVEEPLAAPLIDFLDLDCRAEIDWGAAAQTLAHRVTSRLTVRARHFDEAVLRALCWPIARENPTILWDIVVDGEPPPPSVLRVLRDEWPHEIGYLDRVAVYGKVEPEPAWQKATPRFMIVMPWSENLDPLLYEGIARIMWRLPGEPRRQALDMVAARGGDGIVVRKMSAPDVLDACRSEGLLVWIDPDGAPWDLPGTFKGEFASIAR